MANKQNDSMNKNQSSSPNVGGQQGSSSQRETGATQASPGAGTSRDTSRDTSAPSSRDAGRDASSNVGQSAGSSDQRPKSERTER